MNPGIWQNNFYPDNFWQEDFWPDFGIGLDTDNIHIFSTSVITPTFLSDSGDNVLIKGGVETQDRSYLNGLTVQDTIIPTDSCQIDLGISDNRWKDIYYCGEIFDTSGKTLQERFVDRSLVNGSFREAFDCIATSNGTTVIATLTNADNPSISDLTMQFSDGDTILDTPLTCELTVGSDTSPQANYVYIPVSTKVLTFSTVSFPDDDEEHIKVSYFFISSAVEVQTEGPFITQNWNDELQGGTGQGHLLHMAERIRRDGAYYFSGLDPNGEDQNTDVSYLNYISASVSYFKMSSGSIYQMHKHSIEAFDTQLSDDDMHVINWLGDNYHETSILNTIIADSLGNSLSNKYFNLFFFTVGNKSGTYHPTMVMLPKGSYVTESSAINDVDGFDNLTMPREFSLESSTGVPICRMTLRYSGGTNTLTHISTTDLRSDGLTAGGGATGGTTHFIDNQFDVSAVGDITKTIAFDASSIATGNTRIFTFPNTAGTIITNNNGSDLDHDTLLNGAGNQHIDWTSASANLTTTGSLQASNYKSSDGSVGITQTETSVNTFNITIKNGLITSFTKLT